MLLGEEQVADVVKQKLGSGGQSRETVQCVDDVMAKVGSVVECSGAAGGRNQVYTLTVTSVDNGTANFKIQPKS